MKCESSMILTGIKPTNNNTNNNNNSSETSTLKFDYECIVGKEDRK